jgi:hypothetical protein
MFELFKVLFMAAFGLSIVLYDKHIETERGTLPVWMIAAVQSPIIILYSLFG